LIRVSGGQFRGRQIYCPKGDEVRPTTAFVRESLFNILGQRVVGARFLDLFTGSGIVGIEALSRGAAFVEAVDYKKEHRYYLEKTKALLKLDTSCYKITCMDVFPWCRRLPVTLPKKDRFDIIFLDPPYALREVFFIVEQCFSRQLLASDGILIWESGQRYPPTIAGARMMRTNAYGASNLAFFSYPDPASQEF
jgi:16S rRNA (guanine966-N2)-methyltransferase